MNITYKNVSTPIYAAADKSAIRVQVYFDHLAATVSFCAMASDCEAHGREIYADCVAGKYGPVAAYVKP